MTGPVRFLFAGLALPLVALPALAQGKRPGLWHNDRKHGFAVQILDDWKQIPLQPDERYEIGKFAGPDCTDPKEGTTFQTSLNLIRIIPGPPRRTEGESPASKPADDGGKPDVEALKKEFEERTRARTFEQWLKDASGYMGPVVKQKKELTVSKVKAHEYDFTAKSGLKAGIHGWATVFHIDAGLDVAMVWAGPESQFDKWVGPLRTSAKTFKMIEKEAAPVEAGAATLSSREAKKKALLAGPKGWAVEETENYLIVSDADPKWIPQIKQRIEAIRGRLEKDYPPEAGKPITAVSTLRVCKNSDEYRQYGGQGGTAGYWSPGHEELVIYVDTENPLDTWRTMQHEAFHQYIFYRCGKLAPHSWYNEGTGDYYAGADFKYGKFDIDEFLWRKDLIRQAIRDKKHVPLEKILRYSQAEYYSNRQLCYAEGWSIIFFLREGKKRGARGWNPAWEKFLPTYFEKLLEANARGDDDEKACTFAIEEATRGIDIAELEKAWMAFTA